MLERLLNAEADSGQASAIIEQTKKWGGRLVLTAIMGYYIDSSMQHLKHNKLFRRVDDAIHHHGYHETPDNHEQSEHTPAELIEEPSYA